IVSPVDGSAMAGDTGTRSRGRIRLMVRRRAPRDLALFASTRMSARRREARIGMSESDSTPPASTTSASPSTISSYAFATACPEDAQARFREYAGISLGNCGRRLTSRATFGTSADGTTCPKITAFTSAPSRFVRSSSSRATNRARSTARASFNSVPDLQNGVRQPAITATRRPLATGITFSSRWTSPLSAVKSRNLPRACCRAKLETLDERDAVFPSHARRGTRIAGRRTGRRSRHRGRDHGRRDRPRCGTARLSHGCRRQGRLRRRDVVGFFAAHPRWDPLPRTGRVPPRVRGEPRASCVARDRAALGASAAVPVPGVPRGAGPRLETPRGDVVVRSAGGLPQREGAHVAVARKRVGHTLAVTLTSPIDGRVMFVLPWGDLSYIGTTDTDEDASPDEVRATAQDVVYLLRSVNAFFPHARLSPSDVID